MFGDPFYKFIAVCEVGNFVYLQIAKYRKSISKPVEIKTPMISITAASENGRLSIDPRHMVMEAAISPAPQIDLKTLD